LGDLKAWGISKLGDGEAWFLVFFVSVLAEPPAGVHVMKLFVSVSFFMCVVLADLPFASAQVTPADLPPEFYGAQRGRAVYRRLGSGTWRVRYGRGLTPQGAQVLTTGIQTIVPILPQIIPGLGARSQSAEQSAEQAARSMQPDSVLDQLASPQYRQQKIQQLNQTLKESNELVAAFGGQVPEPIVVTPEPPPARENKQIGLKVAKHRDVQLSDADVRDILRRVSALLQRADGTGDVSAQVELVLDGQVENFADSSIRSDVLTSDQMKRLQTENDQYDVLIVNDLWYCGGKVAPGVLGCARVGQVDVQIVVENKRGFLRDTAAVLWAHELCHNGGSEHRRLEDTISLMSPSIGSTNRRINSSEKESFLALAPAASSAELAAVEMSAQLQEPETTDFREADVRQEVSVLYVEGPPWGKWRSRYAAAAGALGDANGNDPLREQIDTLLFMLGDEKYDPYKGNVLAMLCAMGRPETIEIVQSYIQVHKNAQRSEIMEAVAAGYVYLGMIAGDLRPDAELGAHVVEFLQRETAKTNEYRAAVLRGAAMTEQAAADPLLDRKIATVNAARLIGLGYSGRYEPQDEAVGVARAAIAAATDQGDAIDAQAQSLSTMIRQDPNYASKLFSGRQ